MVITMVNIVSNDLMAVVLPTPSTPSTVINLPRFIINIMMNDFYKNKILMIFSYPNLFFLCSVKLEPNGAYHPFVM